MKKAVRRDSDVVIIFEEVLAGDFQADGLEDKSVKNVQDQLTVIKDSLDRRHSRSSTIDGHSCRADHQQGSKG